MVVAQGLEYNVVKLHQFLFGDNDYQVSKNVENISDYLINYTGIPTVKLPEDEEDDKTEYGNYDYDDGDDDDNSDDEN